MDNSTMILRHRKENLKKCSLHGLEEREDITFYSYPNDSLPDLSNHVLLTLDAPPLSEEDQQYGLFLIDATWKYAEVMMNQVLKVTTPIKRSIPRNVKTAYPRKQTDCSDPEHGLASVEALYLAYTILGRDTTGLLDHYYWAEEFLRINGVIENRLTPSLL